VAKLSELYAALERAAQANDDESAREIASYIKAMQPPARIMPPEQSLIKEPEKASALRRVGDLGLSAVQGAIALPESIVGLADIPTGGRVGKALEGAGFRPKEAKDILQSYKSAEQQEADKYVGEGEGFFDTVGRAIERPSTIAGTVVQSIPSMLGGAGIARGLLSAAPKVGALAAGAIGEGAVSAGLSAEDIRQQSESGLITGKQAGLSTLSGVFTGVLGGFGGKVAQKYLKVGDIDTILAGGITNAEKKGLLTSVIKAGLSEAVLEELPQSGQEQVMRNLALDKPWDEGVAESMAMGVLAALPMGGAAGYSSYRAGERKTAAEEQQRQAALAKSSAERARQDSNLAAAKAGAEQTQYADEERTADLAGFNEVKLLQDAADAKKQQVIATTEALMPELAQRLDTAFSDVMGKLDTIDGVKELLNTPEIKSDKKAQQELQQYLVKLKQTVTAEKKLSKLSDTDIEYTALADVQDSFQKQFGVTSETALETVPLEKLKTALTDLRTEQPGQTNKYIQKKFDLAEQKLVDAIDAHPETLEMVKRKAAQDKEVAERKLINDNIKAREEKLKLFGNDALKRAALTGSASDRAFLEQEQSKTQIPDEAFPVYDEMPELTPEEKAKQLERGLNEQEAANFQLEEQYPSPKTPINEEPVNATVQQAPAEQGNLFNQFGQPTAAALRGASNNTGLNQAKPKGTSERNAVPSTPEETNVGKAKTNDPRPLGDDSGVTRRPESGTETSEETESSTLNPVQKYRAVESELNRLNASKKITPKVYNKYVKMLGKVKIDEIDALASQELGAIGYKSFTKTAPAANETTAAPKTAAPKAKATTTAKAKEQQKTEPSTLKGRSLLDILNTGTELQSYQEKEYGKPKPSEETKPETPSEETKPETPKAKAKEVNKIPSSKAYVAPKKVEPLKTVRDAVKAIEEVESYWRAKDKEAPVDIKNGSDTKFYALKENIPTEPKAVAKWIKNVETATQQLRASVDNIVAQKKLDQDFAEAQAAEAEANAPDGMASRKAKSKNAPKDISGKLRAETTEPTTPELFAEIVSKWFNPVWYKNAIKNGMVNIVDGDINDSDLSDAIKQKYANAKALFTPDGKAYFFIKNITKGNELGVFLHEIGEHRGLDNLIGKDRVKQLANRVRDMAEGKGKVSAKEQAMAKQAIEMAQGQAQNDKEIIAYFGEIAVFNGVRPGAKAKPEFGKATGWITELWSSIKNAINKLHLDFDKVSDKDIVEMLYGAARLELGAAQTFEEQDGGMNMPSNMRSEQSGDVQQTETPAFKKWFGNSKIVNEDGSPKVLYHGTNKWTDAKNNVFKPSSYGTFGPGIYFTDDANKASDFAMNIRGEKIPEVSPEGGNVVPAYLKMEIPVPNVLPPNWQEWIKNRYFRNFDKAIGVAADGYLPMELAQKRATSPDEFEHAKNLYTKLSNNTATTSELFSPIRTSYGSLSNLSWANSLADELKTAGFDGLVISVPEKGMTEYVVFKPEQIKSAVGNRGTFDETDNILASNKTQGSYALKPEERTELESQGYVVFDDLSRPSKYQELSELAGNPAKRQSKMDKLGNSVFGPLYTLTRKTTALYGGQIKNEVTNKLYGVYVAQHALNANNLSSQAALQGALEIGSQGEMYVVKKEANYKKLAKNWKALMAAMERDGISKPMAQQYGSLMAVADRYESLIKRGEKTRDEFPIQNTQRANELKARYGAEFNAWRDNYTNMRNGMRDVIIKSGLMTPKKVDELLNRMEYIPFYRIKDAEALDGVFIKNLLSAKNEQKLVGGTENLMIGDVMSNIMKNQMWLYNRVIYNHTTNLIVDQVEEMGIGKHIPVRPEKAENVISYLRDGVIKHFQFDDVNDMELFKQQPVIETSALRMMKAFSGVLRKTITLTPSFMYRQTWNDALRAWGQSGTDKSFLSLLIQSAGEQVNNFTGENPTELAEDLRIHGIIGAVEFQDNYENFIDNVLGREYKGRFKTLNNIVQTMERAAQNSDMAARAIVYDAAIKEGSTPAEAAVRAQMMLNYQHRGTSPALRALLTTIPFINTQLQSDWRLLEALKGNVPGLSKAKARQLLGLKVAKFALVTAAYAMLRSGDDDYEDATEENRNRNFLFDVGGVPLRIPVAPEYMVLKSTIEQLTRKAIDAEFYTDRKLGHAFFSGLGNLLLSPTDVMPSVIRPFIENITNYSFFQGRALVGIDQRRKLTNEQYVKGQTSEMAKWLSNFGQEVLGDELNVSPIKIDNTLRGLFGTMGQDVMFVTNVIAESVNDRARPSLKLNQLPEVGTAFYDPQGGQREADYYDLKEKVDKRYDTYLDIKKTDPQRANQFRQDNIQYFRIRSQLESIEKQLTNLRARKNKMLESKTMSSEEKAEMRDKISANKKRILGTRIQKMLEGME
jgi:hypothetical protein